MRVETEQTGASRDKRTDVAMEEQITGYTAEGPQSGEARSDFTVAIVEMFSASRILLLLMILILAGMALPEESLAQKRWDEITRSEERRVGKGCRCRGGRGPGRKKGDEGRVERRMRVSRTSVR